MKSKKATQDKPARPFIKWAGGKERLLPVLTQYLPDTFNMYFEPFLGGGAMALHVLSTKPGVKACLSDSNANLIKCWQAVQDNPGTLLHKLRLRVNSFMLADSKEEWYYALREESPNSMFDIASRFISLNKTCFNGLYRENKTGKFNVPFGKYKRCPQFYDEDNILSCSRLLQGVSIECGDFDAWVALGMVRPGDFFYFDPPYWGTFSDYQSKCFHWEDHVRLRRLCTTLDNMGAKFMLSNSYGPETLNLYKGFNYFPITAPRSINCKGTGRQSVTELLVTNYKIKGEL